MCWTLWESPGHSLSMYLHPDNPPEGWVQGWGLWLWTGHRSGKGVPGDTQGWKGEFETQCQKLFFMCLKCPDLWHQTVIDQSCFQKGQIGRGHEAWKDTRLYDCKTKIQRSLFLKCKLQESEAPACSALLYTENISLILGKHACLLLIHAFIMKFI